MGKGILADQPVLSTGQMIFFEIFPNRPRLRLLAYAHEPVVFRYILASEGNAVSGPKINCLGNTDPLRRFSFREERLLSSLKRLIVS